MTKKIIPIEEVLFVFQSWTLVIKSNLGSTLKPGDEIFLFDYSKNIIGKAKINRFLFSKNPDISPIEIEVIETPTNLKDVKFVNQIS